MFTGWFQTSYDKLIEAIKAESEIEAQNLIAKIDIAELNKVDNGDTALTLAASYGLEKVCEMLIPKMSEQAINHVSNNGDTALILAASYGLEKVCEMLIPKMSEQAINHVTNNGETALSLATKHGFKNICDLLTNKKNNLANKADTEEKQEEQQSLKLKQEASVTNDENKQLDIKDLPKAAEKQDTAQENLEEKLVTFQKIVIEATAEIENNITISKENKVVLQDRISEIARTVKTFLNKTDVDRIIKSMEVFANGKITKAKVAVVEEDLIEIIEEQVKLDEHIRAEKLAIFQKVVADITVKLESNTTVNPKDKYIMQNNINRIIDKVQKLVNKVDIETITETTKEIVNSKITKARLGVVEEDLNQLIEQQSKPSHNIIVNKVEEIIDNQNTNNDISMLGNDCQIILG